MVSFSFYIGIQKVISSKSDRSERMLLERFFPFARMSGEEKRAPLVRQWFLFRVPLPGERNLLYPSGPSALHYWMGPKCWKGTITNRARPRT